MQSMIGRGNLWKTAPPCNTGERSHSPQDIERLLVEDDLQIVLEFGDLFVHVQLIRRQDQVVERPASIEGFVVIGERSSGESRSYQNR